MIKRLKLYRCAVAINRRVRKRQEWTCASRRGIPWYRRLVGSVERYAARAVVIIVRARIQNARRITSATACARCGFIGRTSTTFEIKHRVFTTSGDGRPEWIDELPMGIYGRPATASLAFVRARCFVFSYARLYIYIYITVYTCAFNAPADADKLCIQLIFVWFIPYKR